MLLVRYGKTTENEEDLGLVAWSEALQHSIVQLGAKDKRSLNLQQVAQHIIREPATKLGEGESKHREYALASSRARRNAVNPADQIDELGVRMAAQAPPLKNAASLLKRPDRSCLSAQRHPRLR